MHHLHREFHRREEKWEQTHVTAYGQGSESTQVPTVFERQQAERNDNEEYGLLMDVPTEEERSVGAEGDGRDESVPGWLEEELDKGRLR